MMQETWKWPEIAELKKRFTYDPNTGVISSKRAHRAVGGKYGGDGDSYLCVWIRNRRFMCHHVAWAMHYGHWVLPPAELDHINGIRTDNRIANLRMVSRQMQCRNMRLSRRNTTGKTGVHFDQRMKCFGASINVDRKQIWLGRYDTLEQAVNARKLAEAQYGWPQE